MTIPHDKLLTLIRERVVDSSMPHYQAEPQGRGDYQERWSHGGSPARVTDFTAIQQHLPKSTRLVWHSRGHPEKLEPPCIDCVDDVVRHEARIVHGARAPAACRRANLSPSL